MCKLESGEMGSGGEGNQESFIMLTEGKWMNITREKLRIPWLYSGCKNQGKQEQLRILAYDNSEENIKNNRD